MIAGTVHARLLQPSIGWCHLSLETAFSHETFDVGEKQSRRDLMPQYAGHQTLLMRNSEDSGPSSGLKRFAAAGMMQWFPFLCEVRHAVRGYLPLQNQQGIRRMPWLG